MNIYFRKLPAQLLVLVLYVFAHFFIAQQAQASELIGTHLGEGDVGAQIGIINSVLIPQGLEPDSPVTAMVGINMLQPSQVGTVRDLAAAISAGGFFPIVRINDVCKPVDAGSGITPTSAVELARSVFGPDALIVFGNEVNNQEKECANWNGYATGLSAVIGKPNVSPAALDYYMGNPLFTVETMFKSVGALAPLYSRGGPRAANAYGCVGGNKEACDPAATTTQATGYSTVTGPLYLTEFSLSPEGRSEDAPDTDLKKVREFIETQGPLTGAVKITPLVRNVCNNEGEWLIYVNGKFFTNQGSPISEDCQGGGKSGGFDLKKYPDYNVVNTLFYNSPIKNVKDEKRTPELLRKELTAQGYEAYCADEGSKVKAVYNSDSVIKRFIELYPTGVALETESVSRINTTGAQYPVWRSVSGKQHLFASLEEYFGFRDVYEESPTISEIKSSPINSLLSNKQLCIQGWKNVTAQQIMCEKLEGGQIENCAFLNRPVPPAATSTSAGAELTTGGLLELLGKYGAEYGIPTRDGQEVRGCETLLAIPNKTPDLLKLQNGLINFPTYYDRAYRYGFIVGVVKTQPPGTDKGNIATQIFNFFNSPTRGSSPRDELLVAAFKLPDIGTNKGGGDDTASQFWNDPLDLTRQVLTTKEEQFYHEQLSRVKPGEFNDNGTPKTEGTSRSEVRSIAETLSANKAIQNKGDRIYCLDGDWHEGGSRSFTCQNALHKALADIINGTAQGCGDTEPVSIIKDPAGFGDVTDKTGKEFNKDNGFQNLVDLFNESVYNKALAAGKVDMQVAQTENAEGLEKLKSLFTINRSTYGPSMGDATIDYYIVYPMGFEVTAVEEAIKATFFTKEQIAEMDRKQNTVGGFAFSGVSVGLDGGSVGHSYIDPEPDGGCNIEESTAGGVLTKKCTREFNINIEQDSVSFGILGANLGRTLRNIQLALNTKASEASVYIRSCNTMEQFLLGRCPAGAIDSGSNLPEEPTDTLEPVALCPNPPVARIGSGEGADHVTIQGTNKCTGKLTRTFVPEKHDIPRWKDQTDLPRGCERMYEYVACNTEYKRTLIQNPIVPIPLTNGTQFSSLGTMTACEYVVTEAQKLGVSPRLALAIWGEESGFSAYRTYDFGVVSQPKQNIGLQLRAFANTTKSYATYEEFLKAYAGEERDKNEFCVNPNFVARLKKFYDYLEP